MPQFYKRGAAYCINPKSGNPNSDYAKTFRAKLQQKLEALTKPPQPVTTLAQMSPEKQAEMRALYLPPEEVGDRPIPRSEFHTPVPRDLAPRLEEMLGPFDPKPLKTVLETGP